MKSLRGDAADKSIDHVKSKPTRHTRSDSQTRSANNTCRNCGSHHAPRSCPAYGKQCLNCKKQNHFAKCCRQSKKGKYRPQSQSPSRRNSVSENAAEVNSVEGNSVYFDAVQSNKNHTEKSWIKSMYISGSVIPCKLDSGAEANVMGKSVFDSLKYRPQLRSTDCQLYGVGGHQLSPVGVATVKLHHKRKCYDTEFFVVNASVQTLLGLPSCKQLDLLRIVDVATNKSVLDEFSDVFTGVGCMPIEHHIVIDPSVEPVVHPARCIPLSVQPKLKLALDNLEKAGIICKRDEPTDWVNSLLIVEKRDHSLRLCLDPRDLNKAIKREHYPIKTVDDIASQLHGKRVFSAIDLKDGFYNVKLDEASSKLCTFNTMFGRYSFRRLPFGISSSPEVFYKRMEQLFGDIEGVHVVFDDLIIAAVDVTQHDMILRNLLTRARQFNVRFNKNKLQLRVEVVKYLGHRISSEGLKVDVDKVKAITEMPPPTDKKALLRFLGLIAYVAKFIPRCSSLTEPLRQLCKANVHWEWTISQQQAFDELKRVISQAPVLRFFDPLKPVTIQTDSSSTGLGSCLLQDGQPIAYASRALLDTEKRYAQIEKELLAIVFACEKFHMYIYGRKTHVQSDHKPLEAIFQKPINATTPRLQRMLMKLLKYDLDVRYTPGVELKVADALSRAYLPVSDNDVDNELTSDVTVMIHTLLNDFPASNRRLEQLRVETERDSDLSKLKQCITEGFPTNSSLSAELKQFKKITSEIYNMDGLLFVHGKLIVPASVRPDMLSIVHEGHLGMEKCKAVARQSLFWPGMSKDIEHKVASCLTCNKYCNEQTKEPLIPHSVPQRPWQKVGADIFSFARRDYLLVVDYYSKFPEVAFLEDKTAFSVIRQLKVIFARHGIPEEVIADNMPFASKQINQFATEWDFKITTSSPTYAQSNGQSERHIQTVKKLLKKAAEEGSDPLLALLQFRNAPISGLDVSPAQLLFSRKLRTKLPMTSQSLKPAVVNRFNQLVNRQAHQKRYYDASGTRTLPTLQPGDVVRVMNDGEWQMGKVVSKHTAPRSYTVQTEHGSLLRRNRRHLIRTQEAPPMCSTDIDVNQPQSEATAPATTQQPAVPSPPGIIKTRSGREVKRSLRFDDYV